MKGRVLAETQRRREELDKWGLRQRVLQGRRPGLIQHDGDAGPQSGRVSMAQ